MAVHGILHIVVMKWGPNFEASDTTRHSLFCQCRNEYDLRGLRYPTGAGKVLAVEMALAFMDTAKMVVADATKITVHAHSTTSLLNDKFSLLHCFQQNHHELKLGHSRKDYTVPQQYRVPGKRVETCDNLRPFVSRADTTWGTFALLTNCWRSGVASTTAAAVFDWTVAVCVH